MAIYIPRTQEELKTELEQLFGTALPGAVLDVLIAGIANNTSKIENQVGLVEQAIQSIIIDSQLKIERGRVSTADALISRLLDLSYVTQATVRLLVQGYPGPGPVVALVSNSQLVAPTFANAIPYGIIVAVDVGGITLSATQEKEIADLLITYVSMGTLFRNYLSKANYIVQGETATGYTQDAVFYTKESGDIDIRVTFTLYSGVTSFGIDTLYQEIQDLINNNEKMGGNEFSQFNPAEYDCKVLGLFDTDIRRPFGVTNAFVEYSLDGGTTWLRDPLDLELQFQINVASVITVPTQV